MAFWHNIQNTKYCYLIGKCQNRKITLTRFGYSDDMTVKSKDSAWRECGMSRQQTTKFHRQNHESDVARPSCSYAKGEPKETSKSRRWRWKWRRHNYRSSTPDGRRTEPPAGRWTHQRQRLQRQRQFVMATAAVSARRRRTSGQQVQTSRLSRRRASSAARTRRREASGCDDASSNTSFYITFSLFLLALGVGFGWTFNHYTIDIFLDVFRSLFHCIVVLCTASLVRLLFPYTCSLY